MLLVDFCTKWMGDLLLLAIEVAEKDKLDIELGLKFSQHR
jgi:hypothetical protein